MKSTKFLGIWMDHLIAHVIKFENGSIVTDIIESNQELHPQPDEYSEYHQMLNSERDSLSVYYRKLSDIILNFEHVVLFGPENSKNELLYLLLYNHLFDKINLAVKPADHMNETERKSFIRDNFFMPEITPKIFQNRVFAFI